VPTRSVYEHGAWKAICDVCGREFKSYHLRMRWDGLMVDQQCWEPRHPQDFVRGVADKVVPPWTRPEQQDTFVFVCTSLTSQGIADYGVADCAMAGINNNIRPTCTADGSLAITGDAVSGCAITGITSPPLNSYPYKSF
jgi:hypothetical protein